jgi:hypothetical protein
MALADNLTAYWSLDEASGNAIDAHSTNDLPETGGTITSTTGKVGNCRVFLNADTEWFELADNAALSTGDIDFTIAAWLYFDTGSIAAFPMAVSKFSATAAQAEHIIYLDTNANRFTFRIGSGGSAVDVVANNHGAVSGNTWYFVVAWHDSVNNQTGISVNAGTADTQAHSGGVNDGNAPFQIGAGTYDSRYWDGRIDEVGFWKRVLSGAERTELYNAGSGRDYAYITGGGGGIIKQAASYYNLING